MAGILEPNDGLCHLDEKGYYTKAEIQVFQAIYIIIFYAVRKKIYEMLNDILSIS